MRTDPKLLGYARALRKEMTRQERHLWYDFLRGHPWKFYKQRPIGVYIADFYCPASHLVVELDGGQHYEGCGMARDEARDRFLGERGLTVLRFSDLDIERNFSGVCTAIDTAVRTPSQSATG